MRTDNNEFASEIRNPNEVEMGLKIVTNAFGSAHEDYAFETKLSWTHIA